MADTPLHSVSVAGVVVNGDGDVLVIKRRDNGRWEPPGGVLELAEDFEQGVEREVLEEAGLRVRVEALTGVYKNLHLGVVALVFRCAALSDAIESSAEAAEVRWISRDDVDQLVEPVYAVRITDAFERAAVTRIHDGKRLIDRRRGR